MEGIEFFTSPEGQVYYRKDGQDAKRLTKFSSDIVSKVVNLVRNRFPECYSRLAIIYKKNASQMVDRFVRCNFGEHDLLTPDIERDILHFEEVRCPLRGICPDENIICTPQSLYRLTPAEKEVAKLYLRGDTFDMIARELGKSPSTVKQQLWKLKKKLGAKNCREIIRVLRIHNI